jgi:hypothetical protein
MAPPKKESSATPKTKAPKSTAGSAAAKATTKGKVSQSPPKDHTWNPSTKGTYKDIENVNAPADNMKKGLSDGQSPTQSPTTTEKIFVTDAMVRGDTAKAKKSPNPTSPLVEPLTPMPVSSKTEKGKKADESFPKPPVTSHPTPVVKKSNKDSEFSSAFAAAADDLDLDLDMDSESDTSEVGDAEVLDKRTVKRLSDQKFYQFMRGWTDIVTAVPRMSSVAELKTWVGNSIFRVPMLEYLENHYWPRQAKKTHVRGVNFATVMATITGHARMRSRDLFRQDIDRSQWTGHIWLASVLFRLNRDNEADGDGLYPGQPLPQRRKYMVLFCLMKIFLKDMSPSWLDKGLPLLCLSDDEKSAIFSRFPMFRVAWLV